MPLRHQDFQITTDRNETFNIPNALIRDDNSYYTFSRILTPEDEQTGEQAVILFKIAKARVQHVLNLTQLNPNEPTVDAEQQKELYESLDTVARNLLNLQTLDGVDEFIAILKKLMYNSNNQAMWDVVKRWTNNNE